MNREELILKFNETTEGIIEKISNTDKEMFRVKPENGKWSYSETAEHVYLTDILIYGIVKGKKKSEPNEYPARKISVIDLAMNDKEKKFTAFGPLIPQGKFNNRTEAKSAIASERDCWVKLLQEVDLDKVCLNAPHPLFGELTGTEWTWFLISHTQRHIENY